MAKHTRSGQPWRLSRGPLRLSGVTAEVHRPSGRVNRGERIGFTNTACTMAIPAIPAVGTGHACGCDRAGRGCLVCAGPIAALREGAYFEAGGSGAGDAVPGRTRAKKSISGLNITITSGSGLPWAFT